ncbi:hypothetical protein K9M79_00370 [Candidatus Woesearchaeota archaeon]|nr:hypothetical protein [Candidatus Woesearchaeota archaeon]
MAKGVDRLDFNDLMKMQSIMNKSVKNDLAEEMTIDIIAMINQLTFDNKAVLKENILIEGSRRGYDESGVNKCIQNMIRDKTLFEPKEGYIQRF